MKHPVRFAASPAATRAAPPKLGQDTEAVLREAGVSLPKAAE
jgi:crotonobetainyl-CoA:carnitine CoA-transferase CaiB-like acyl-CoA transferase